MMNNEGDDNYSCKYKSYTYNVKEFQDNDENPSLFRQLSVIMNGYLINLDIQ